MRNRPLFILFILLLLSHAIQARRMWVEAESFVSKGGWVVDQQFTELMGSPYLMVHGMGKPIADAETMVHFSKAGQYHVYVRTFNWTSPWHSGAGAGRFCLLVDNQPLQSVGDRGTQWEWHYAGEVMVKKGATKLALHDLTGFNGRCDAIYFTDKKDDLPPTDKNKLIKWREKLNPHQDCVQEAGEYDLVVAGAGVAGMCAAVAAARNGLRVALINDRPVIGGNNSSEIRVHLGGRIESKPYNQLGNLIKEMGPLREGNAQPADYYEDDKKMAWIKAEKNITLFLNQRLFAVEMGGKRIKAIKSRHIETGEVIRLQAPLFADCTGDGTLGYLAGADFRMGRESRSEFNEVGAPDTADNQVMGASVQWYSDERKEEVSFPDFRYGLSFNEANAQPVTMGEWTWETGMNFNQIHDFEYIRDYGLMVIFSNWAFLKNHSQHRDNYANRQLSWVAYVAGKRESRRLLGDHILTENDLLNAVCYPDATASTTWSIDLHYPDPENSRYFPGREFKSIAKHRVIHAYPVPYRCLYSRNVDNLFMAGRNISVTHVALGTIRVMRTTGMLGEVVGLAASVCKKEQAMPREVYNRYWEQMTSLLQQGAGKRDLPNNQQYNEGGTLGNKW